MLNLIALLVTVAGIILMYIGSYNIAIFLVGNTSAFRRYGTATLLFIGIIGFLIISSVAFSPDQQPVIVQYVPVLLK